MTSPSTIPSATFQPPVPKPPRPAAAAPQPAPVGPLDAQEAADVQALYDALPEDHRCRTIPIFWDNARPTPHPAVEEITPELASSWLASNLHNRRFSAARTSNAAGDMAAGRWLLTGEAIKFDYFGHVMDGQHRLEAIVTSGVPVTTFVVRGLDPATQEVMDSGARRSAGDALSLRGMPDSKEAASIIRRIIQWEDGVRERNFRLSRNSATTGQVLEWADAHPGIVEIVAKSRAATNVPMPQAARGLLMYLFMQVEERPGQEISPAVVDEFFARLGDGAGLTEHHPILTLRNKLLAERSRARVRIAETAYLDMTIRAWNAWREGRILIRMQINNGKDTAVPTPR